MQNFLQDIFRESLRVKEATLTHNMDSMLAAAEAIIQSLRQGGKVILFGNGGSAADSQHIAAEFIGRFQKERCSLPALALTTDTSALTAVANDYGFEFVFARQLEGLGKPGDVAWAISTSGNSPNVLEAVKVAKTKNMKTIALTGCGGGKLASACDIKIVVPSEKTARIQESHICVAHAICELVENKLSSSAFKP